MILTKRKEYQEGNQRKPNKLIVEISQNQEKKDNIEKKYKKTQKPSLLSKREGFMFLNLNSVICKIY
jgi:hypothetical protein